MEASSYRGLKKNAPIKEIHNLLNVPLKRNMLGTKLLNTLYYCSCRDRGLESYRDPCVVRILMYRCDV